MLSSVITASLGHEQPAFYTEKRPSNDALLEGLRVCNSVPSSPRLGVPLGTIRMETGTSPLRIAKNYLWVTGGRGTVAHSTYNSDPKGSRTYAEPYNRCPIGVLASNGRGEDLVRIPTGPPASLKSGYVLM